MAAAAIDAIVCGVVPTSLRAEAGGPSPSWAAEAALPSRAALGRKSSKQLKRCRPARPIRYNK